MVSFPKDGHICAHISSRNEVVHNLIKCHVIKLNFKKFLGNSPSKVTYDTSRKKNNCSALAPVLQSSHQGTSDELFDDLMYPAQKRQRLNPFSTYCHSQLSLKDPDHPLMADNYGPTTMWYDPPIYFSDCEKPSSSRATKTRKLLNCINKCDHNESCI